MKDAANKERRTIETERTTPAKPSKPQRSPGFWRESIGRFIRRRLALLAFFYILFLFVVGLFAPAIVGTKPIVCQYKGKIYFPALGYFNSKWENPIFRTDRITRNFPANLQRKDPESWAIWPLVYQDPNRRVRREMAGQPENKINQPPNRFNLFGTNADGIDCFAVIVHGTQTALLVGFVSTGIAAVIGIILGATAGFFRGWTDVLISRFIDVVMCIPTLILILALIAVLDRPTIWHMMAVIGMTSWTGIARLTRGEFLRLREADFVLSARSLGAGWLRIMVRHILPNSLAPILVPITFGIASAILIENGLSFLGFGIPSAPSWGRLLAEGQGSLREAPWLVIFPGLAVFSTVLAYNLVGEGIQDSTDPRLRDASGR